MAKKGILKDLELTGQDFLDTISELIQEGNVREIEVYNKKGKRIYHFNLTGAFVFVIFVPVLIAAAAIVGKVNGCTVKIKRIRSARTKKPSSKKKA
jgi:hypothetical protein